MKKTLIMALILMSAVLTNAQFDKNYSPIVSTGKLPQIFLDKVENGTLEDISREGELKGKKGKSTETFYVNTNIALKQLFLSGNVYFNDEISAYLNKVSSAIVAKNPSIKKPIKVFATKSTVPNAYAFGKGYIMINIGLLSRVENEAQLAFILCHEIAHVQKRHSLLMHRDEEEYKDKNRFSLKKSNELERLFERLKYSRQHEYEADAYGFELFQRMGYSLEAAKNALALLKSIKANKYNHSILLPTALTTVDSATIADCKSNYQEKWDCTKKKNFL